MTMEPAPCLHSREEIRSLADSNRGKRWRLLALWLVAVRWPRYVGARSKQMGRFLSSIIHMCCQHFLFVFKWKSILYSSRFFYKVWSVSTKRFHKPYFNQGNIIVDKYSCTLESSQNMFDAIGLFMELLIFSRYSFFSSWEFHTSIKWFCFMWVSAVLTAIPNTSNW